VEQGLYLQKFAYSELGKPQAIEVRATPAITGGQAPNRSFFIRGRRHPAWK
jgi:hypothetical protein